jgi:ABC-type nitrate/sulfonate/bicarbonate transport system permease component
VTGSVRRSAAASHRTARGRRVVAESKLSAPPVAAGGDHIVPDRLARPMASARVRRWFRAPKANIVLTGLVVGAAVLWELVSRLGIVSEDFISRPTAIAAAIPGLVADEAVREAVATTVSTIAIAIAGGVLVGIVLGYLLGSVRLLRDAFYGPALFLMSVPKSVFIPIFLVLFGINSQTSIYYGAFSGVIYVMINVISGLDLVEERHLRVATAYGASMKHRIIDVIFPASMPGVFTGIWYGLKNGMQGVLIFELFISVGGLGGLISFYTNGLRTDRVFAIILGISLAAILLGEGWSRLERRLSRWRQMGSSEAATQAQAS